MDKKQEAIAAERGKVYGDPKRSHANIGLEWTGILQQYFDIELPHAIPPHVVAEMMVALKVNRSLRVHHEDNYDDRAVYTSFAKGWLSELTTPTKTRKVVRGRK